MSLSDRLSYFLWAAKQWPAIDTSCPACGADSSYRLRTKAIVTALYRCPECHLMFRVPKDSLNENEQFYQSQYQQGFTTDVPSESQLARLIDTHFRNSEKSYEVYESILNSLGLRPGDTVYDFGCSWGYGSWQLAQAGYEVYSYEISEPRATYAREKLGCRMIQDPCQLPRLADCFFSAHVIEHLPNPHILWKTAAQTLRPDGVVVIFMPNGDPAIEELNPKAYHRWWGKVHPLLISAQALHQMACSTGFVGHAHTSPYHLGALRSSLPGDLSGSELLYVARRSMDPGTELLAQMQSLAQTQN